MRYHICQSVRGPLHNWTNREWKNACKWITPKAGGHYTPDQLKSEFLGLLADGWEVIPFGDDCDNFDKKKGCLGHPQPESLTQ